MEQLWILRDPGDDSTDRSASSTAPADVASRKRGSALAPSRLADFHEAREASALDVCDELGDPRPRPRPRLPRSTCRSRARVRANPGTRRFRTAAPPLAASSRVSRARAICPRSSRLLARLPRERITSAEFAARAISTLRPGLPGLADRPVRDPVIPLVLSALARMSSRPSVSASSMRSRPVSSASSEPPAREYDSAIHCSTNAFERDGGTSAISFSARPTCSTRPPARPGSSA